MYAKMCTGGNSRSYWLNRISLFPVPLNPYPLTLPGPSSMRLTLCSSRSPQSGWATTSRATRWPTWNTGTCTRRSSGSFSFLDLCSRVSHSQYSTTFPRWPLIKLWGGSLANLTFYFRQKWLRKSNLFCYRQISMRKTINMFEFPPRDPTSLI